MWKNSNFLSSRTNYFHIPIVGNFWIIFILVGTYIIYNYQIPYSESGRRAIKKPKLFMPT